MPYLEVDPQSQQLWAGELRQITVVFVDLALPLNQITKVTNSVLHLVVWIFVFFLLETERERERER